MVFQLNNYQLEVNCRRLFVYNKNSLSADENGTLHYRDKWYSGIPFFKHKDYSASEISTGIPASMYRNRNIRSAVLSTLTGICAQMRHEHIPISMFMIPGVVNNNCSYESLAKKVFKEFSNDDEIKQMAMTVISIFNSIDYHFVFPKKLKEEEIAQVNKYVTYRLRSFYPKRVDLPRKEEHVLYNIQSAQKEINENRIRDVKSGMSKRLKWAASGDWQKGI